MLSPSPVILSEAKNLSWLRVNSAKHLAPGSGRSGKSACIVGFTLFAQTPEAIGEAYAVIVRLLAEGAIKPLVARTFPLAEAAEAQHFLIEERPFGKVVLTL